WFRGLQTARWPSGLLELWRDVGALDRWLPEIGKREMGNGKGGTRVIDQLPPDPVLITSYLSADPVATLTRLRCSNAEIERGRRMAEHREAWPDPVSEAAVRRWLANVGPAADDLLNLAEAEGWGDVLVETAGRVARSKAPLSLGDLAITGNDLLAAGVPKGPAVGETLRALLDRVLDDPSLNTREKLLELAARFPVSRSRFPDSRRKGRRT
ncbi:MAG: hypothetical protein HYV20_02870, partial [Gemmatimonadetes bacterium]|nr:hypothetical protein [Gemmatimonadota bacterium]